MKTISIFIFSILMLHCTAKQISKATYPPDFQYLSEDRISSSMFLMANYIQELEMLFEHRGGEQKDVKVLPQQVLQQLIKIESTANMLDGSQTNHPILDQNIGQFLQDVTLAKNAVQMDPPSYHLAKNLSTSCYNCHSKH